MFREKRGTCHPMKTLHQRRRTLRKNAPLNTLNGIHKKYFPVKSDVYRKIRVKNMVEVFLYFKVEVLDKKNSIVFGDSP
jgi:hypothetical protein